MSEVPDFETRRALADEIRDDPFLQLDDFTRDGYQTLIVSAMKETALEELTARADEVGYRAHRVPDGQKLILEARNRASEKVRMGGNRL